MLRESMFVVGKEKEKEKEGRKQKKKSKKKKKKVIQYLEKGKEEKARTFKSSVFAKRKFKKLKK